VRALVTAGLLAAGCGRIAFDAVDPTEDAATNNPAACPPLPPLTMTTTVGDTAGLVAAINALTPGTTILLQDGTYTIGSRLSIGVASVTLRSASGDPARVVLDANGGLDPVIHISADDVTVADLTIARAGGESIQIEGQPGGDVDRVAIYNVTFRDGRGTPVRGRPLASMVTGPYVERGLVACSRMIASTASSPACNAPVFGIKVEAARAWTVRDNVFDRRACTNQSFRTVWFDDGSRDTLISNNRFLGTAYNIMLGGGGGGVPRTYADPPPAACAGVIWHRDGVVCNNVIDGAMLPPATGADFAEGIALWNACDPWVLHNTIVSPSSAETLTSIEYRFAGAYVHLANNLLLQAPTPRDGAPAPDPAYAASNVPYGSLADFVDAPGGDLRLLPSASVPVGADIRGLAFCTTDATGAARNLASPTVGAYER
jgi:hypothetical protein